MKNGRRKFLFVSQDAGGFNAIFPVYRELKNDAPDDVRGVFGDVVKNSVKDPGVPFVDAKTFTQQDLETVFQEMRPDVVIVGTSSGLSIDKLAIDIAKTKGIPSIAILDFWSNYALRFSDPGTSNLAHLPDRILVMDDISAQEMAKEGIDPKRITVTGNPAFDAFHIPFPPVEGAGIISFLSQPFSELKRNGSGIDYGYDELEVLHDVVRALEEIGVTQEIVVKHHPRTQDLSVFDDIIARSTLRIRTDRDTPTDATMAQSILVIGMSTIALFEAALRGKPVLSYQPHLNREDPLIGNRLGISVCVYDKDGLVPALKTLLSGQTSSSIQSIRDRYAHGHATQDVIHFIHSL